jgi:hypothetical protein
MAQNNMDGREILVAGMTAKELIDMLDSNEAEFAAKALNYYDGKQEQEVERLLSHPDKGRKEWKRRGYLPRHRNITKMVVDKSALLFKDAPPQLEVRRIGTSEVDTMASERLMDILDGTDWLEVMANLDVVVRLLKTAILLVQMDDTTGKPVFDILHRANANVVINPLTKQIDTLVQRTGCAGGTNYYRVWTADQVIDLVETRTAVSIAAQEENTYGAVPAAVFYDTSVPRAGFWAEAPHDLVNVNEMYNLHLTDSEFAISWMKRPSLFTNCELDGYSDEQIEVVEVHGSALPRAVSRTPSLTAGPDVAVQVGSAGGEAPFIDYKAPQIDIKPMDEVVQGWIKQAAADWSVRVRADGEGTASSGFQVVVEEAPNLELRQQRQRMFEGSFKRLYRTLKAVSPSLAQEGELFAVFAKPSLPVDLQAQEDVWSKKISEGRATELDYFMEVQGLTKEEALAKWIEITEFRTAKAKVNEALQPSATDGAQASEEDE